MSFVSVETLPEGGDLLQLLIASPRAPRAPRGTADDVLCAWLAGSIDGDALAEAFPRACDLWSLQRVDYLLAQRELRAARIDYLMALREVERLRGEVAELRANEMASERTLEELQSIAAEVRAGDEDERLP